MAIRKPHTSPKTSPRPSRDRKPRKQIPPERAAAELTSVKFCPSFLPLSVLICSLTPSIEITTCSGRPADEGASSRTSHLNPPVNIFSASGEPRLSLETRRAAILLPTDPKTHRVRRPVAGNSRYEGALGRVECTRLTSGRPLGAAYAEIRARAGYVQPGRCIILNSKETRRAIWLNCLFPSG